MPHLPAAFGPGDLKEAVECFGEDIVGTSVYRERACIMPPMDSNDLVPADTNSVLTGSGEPEATSQNSDNPATKEGETDESTEKPLKSPESSISPSRKDAHASNGESDKPSLKVETDGAKPSTALESSATSKSTTANTTPSSTLPNVPAIPTAFTSLTAEQKEKLANAKAYAREQTTILLAAFKQLNPSMPNPINPLLMMNTSAAEARTLATMSRIYVGSISFDLNDVHIKEVFSQFGSVKTVTMSLDPTTQKHKGFCFVEFDCPEAADIALFTMNGSDLGGRNLKVGRPHNYNPTIGQSLSPAPENRVFVANVNEAVTEEMVQSIFESFGEVKACALLILSYIDFVDDASAASAVTAIQSGAFELGGLRLRATKAIVGGPIPEGMKALDKIPIIENPMKVIQGVASAVGLPSTTPAIPLGVPSGINSKIASALQSAVQKVQAAVMEESSSLEDNLSISASQRYSIMQKLLRKDEKAPLESPVVNLKNIVKVDEIDPDLSSEISEECSKYGQVVKVIIWVDPAQNKGPDGEVNIFVQFGTVEDANRARTALNGRWFGGRKVEALPHDLAAFNTLADSMSESK
ncbi:Poly(U)-binding-splicing factor puf60 [Dinochytrium kinnereticum]|nr:Poly(U)-binding-splicing factor puf60 [Dinochytrium kinnereticum]